MREPVRNLPWARWLGEFMVIVVGVLVALAVDEWRGSVAQAAEERALLVQLLDDVRSRDRRRR